MTESDARLAPLVDIAYSIYRDRDHFPGPPASTVSPPPPGGPPGSPEFLEFLAQGLEEEIEEGYTFPPAGFRELVGRVEVGTGTAFTETDCRRAVARLSELLREGLLVESTLGDGPQAVDELTRRIPGLSSGLYADLIGWLAMKNH